MKVSFYGGVQGVTGACYLLESHSTKILVDCGLFQCPRVCEARNHEPFPFNARDIDVVIVTHAHIDHTGRLPKLVKEGFGGKIFSTSATRDLARLMLEDSLGLMLRENENTPLLFDKDDLAKTFETWEGLEYHHKFQVGDFSIQLRDAGHILGSAMIELEVGERKIVATGDIGNPPTPLLRPTEKITDAHFFDYRVHVRRSFT